jgi:hypothetical protein
LTKRWGAPFGLVACLATLLTACAGAAGDTAAATEAASGLPIAAAPSSDPQAASAPPQAEPEWSEPDDPLDAYRELTEKINYLRAHPSPDMLAEIYAADTRIMRAARRSLKRRIDAGVRLVEGRTVVEDVVLLGKDADTALLEVDGRQQRSVIADAQGNRRQQPEHCQSFEVELRDDGDGWRIAALTVDEDENSWSCEQ